MEGIEVTIKMEGDPEILMGGEGVEEYEKSLKNAIVLSSPGVHPPDVDVEANVLDTEEIE